MDDGELLKAIGSGSSVLSAGGAGVELEVHLSPASSSEGFGDFDLSGQSNFCWLMAFCAASPDRRKSSIKTDQI
jgi:hypothetical protein